MPDQASSVQVTIPAEMLDYVRGHYDAKDAAHDFRHIERIIDRLPGLSDGVSPPPDHAMLGFLACFHGLGARVRTDPEFALEVRGLLDRLGWTREKVEEAIVGITRHIESPTTSAEKVVHDANEREKVGAFTVAKHFLTTGARGGTYEDALEYFRSHVDGIKFFTPAGAAGSEDAVAYARSFFDRLESELR